MTLRPFKDNVPLIAESAWVSETAYVVGDVEIGEDSSIWPGTVIRGDVCSIRIGKRSHIEDNCVLHSADVLRVGDDVIVGHSVVLHGRSIGTGCLIASHATVLDDVEVGDSCLVGAGALLRPGTVVPANSFVVGIPAVIRPATSGQKSTLRAMLEQQPERGYGALMRAYKTAGL